MWNKIKKYWALIFVPIGLFILALFKRNTNNSYVKKELKEEKAVIEEELKVVEKTEDRVEVVEKAVEEIVNDVEHIIEDNLEDKKVRDEKASSFFPGL